MDHTRSDPAVHMQLGVVSMEQEQWPQAISDYSTALSMLTLVTHDARLLAEADYSLALVLEFSGNLLGAKKHILSAHDRIVNSKSDAKGKGRDTGCVDNEEINEILQDFRVKISEIQEKIDNPEQENVTDSMGRVIGSGTSMKRDAVTDVSGLVKKRKKTDVNSCLEEEPEEKDQ